MSFKNLLVYLDGSDRSETVMRVAMRFAIDHQARLCGLHVVGFLLPEQTGAEFCPYSGSSLSHRNLLMARSSGRETAGRAEEIFRTHLAHGGIDGEWYSEEGMVAFTVGLRARHFDATIVGQIDPEHPPFGTRRLVPEALLLESGRPVLVIPCTGEFGRIGDNVLIGWDGSREAARAVNDAIPILETARSVVVLTILRGTPEAGAICPDPAIVAAHLTRHGIKATSLTRQIKTKTIAEALLGHATKMRADLLVMGGYGHSRLWEFVLGGTTRDVLRHMTLPVLMSH